MRYIVSRTTHTASNLAVQMIIGAVRYVDGYYITSKHVHAYLWPRVPNMGCFWKIFILKAGIAVSIRSVSFSVFELRLARMQELRLDDNKADTWRQHCGEVLYGFGPNQTFVALTWPLYCPDDDLMMILGVTIGDVMGLILMVVMVVVLEHPFRGLWQQWERTRGRIRQISLSLLLGLQVLMLDVFTIVPACNLMQCRFFPCNFYILKLPERIDPNSQFCHVKVKLRSSSGFEKIQEQQPEPKSPAENALNLGLRIGS